MYIPKSYKQEVQLPVLDQGTFPTCAAAASASAMSYILKTKHSTNPYAASIAQLWNSAKSIDGKEGKAGMEGTELSSIIKGAVHFGWLYECELPYLKKNIYPHNTFTNQALFSFQSGRVPKKDLSAPTIRTESPAKRAPSLLKIALLKQKSIVIGSSWFSFWWTPSVKNSGVLPMPFPWEKSEGGHAVTIIGWEDVEGVDGGGYFYIQNSWGKNWGDEGYGRIPYAYFERGLIGGSILFS
jgi:hypothetical protein